MSARTKTPHLISSPRQCYTKCDESVTSRANAAFRNLGPRRNCSHPEEKGKKKRGGNKKREKEQDEEKFVSFAATGDAA
jgi:hypothetical protein